MRQEEFESRYQDSWDLFARQVEQAESKFDRKSRVIESAEKFPENYRQLCYCLALARTRQYSPYLIQRLESLVFRGHQLFYQKRLEIFNKIYQFIVYGFPVAVREQSTFFWIATALFYLPGLIVFGLTLIFPEMIYSVVDSMTVAQIESMYDPGADRLGRERQSDTDFMMFGYYIKNNVGIAFQTFSGGILLTLGSQFFLIYNGIFFGAIDAHIINIGYQEPFYAFVAGHSSFELTGIVLSGAAGLQLGWAVIAPGNFSRKQALINAGKRAMVLVYGAILLLLLAAFVEAFWSSISSIAPVTKYWVGIINWLLVIFYLTFLGRRRAKI